MKPSKLYNVPASSVAKASISSAVTLVTTKSLPVETTSRRSGLELICLASLYAPTAPIYDTSSPILTPDSLGKYKNIPTPLASWMNNPSYELPVTMPVTFTKSPSAIS